MKPLLLALNLVCGGDAVTTHVALAHGAAEVLLPSQRPWMTTMMIAGESAGMSLGLSWLDRRHHPKAARVLGWTVVGIRGAVVLSNLRQLAK